MASVAPKINIHVIPIEPTPWRRAGIYGKRFFDLQASLKKKIINCFNSPEALLSNKPLHLVMLFLMKIPKSLSKKKKLELNGKPHKKAPDLSNMIKFIEDTFNKYIWEDDRLISKISAEKRYSHISATAFSVVPHVPESPVNIEELNKEMLKVALAKCPDFQSL